MNKQTIRRWAWVLAAVAAVTAFFALLLNKWPLLQALFGGLICGIGPLFLAGWLLFSPYQGNRGGTSVPRSPLGIFGPNLPTIDSPQRSAGRKTPRGKRHERPRDTPHDQV